MMRISGFLGIMVFSAAAFAAPVRFDVETGNGLHVLRPGEEEKLCLSAANDDAVERKGAIGYLVTDADGEVVFNETVPVELPANGVTRIALPKPEKFGPYYLRCQFEGEGGDLRKQPPLRFAYLEPAGPTPGRSEGFIFGISAHYDYPEYTRRERELMTQAAAWCGGKVVRTDARWALLQPSAGVWRFDYFDEALDLFEQNHLDMAAIVDHGLKWTYAADWVPAVPENKNPWAARPDYDKWRAYLRTVAERYKGRLRFVEVMNEINMHIHHNFTPEEYGELLKIAHEEIKRADPATLILTAGLASVRGNTAPTPDWYRRFFKACGDNYDIFAFHNHGHFTDYVGEVRTVDALREAAGNTKPRWSNETALTSAAGGERFQAETLYCKFLYTWANGGIGYNWYNLRDKPAKYFPADSGEPHFGLVTADFYPKPVFVAYNTLAKNLYKAEFVKNANAGGGAGRDVFSYLFRRQDGGFVLTFFRTGEDTTLQLVSGVTGKVFRCDLWGNETPLPVSGGSVAVPVGPRPVFLRFEEQKANPELLGEFLASESFFLFPGKKQPVRFLLRNPIAAPLAVTLGVKPVEGLNITPSNLRLTATPGAAVPAEFVFDAAADFREGEMELAVDAGALWKGTLRFALKPAIRIDETFGALPSLTIDRPGQVVRLVPHEPGFEPLYWKGPRDLSAKVWLARSANRLKLRVEVTDDRHCQPWSGTEVWRGDNVQLGIQLPRQDVFWEIGLTRRDGGTSEVFVWSLPSGFKADLAARRITLQTDRDENAHKTVYEAEIPFNAIGLTPEMGRTGFRFNLLVNDCDDGKTRESFISAAPGLGDTKNPADFLTVCF